MTAPIWLLQYYCPSMTAPAWLLQYECPNMTVPVWLPPYECLHTTVPIWLLQYECSNMTAPICLLQYECPNMTAPVWLLQYDCLHTTVPIRTPQFRQHLCGGKARRWARKSVLFSSNDLPARKCITECDKTSMNTAIMNVQHITAETVPAAARTNHVSGATWHLY